MTEDFEKILHDLGVVLLREVEAEMSGRPWNSAALDVQYDKGGGSWMSKIRITTSDPEKLSLRVSGKIDDLVDALDAQRRLFADPWYGVILKLGADGGCNMTLNYDENCSNDAAFFND
jgi:hypothetical protein